MDLNSRLDVMVQAVTIAQKSGVLTLEEAAAAKEAIDFLSAGNELEKSVELLSQISQNAQKRGAYTLQDAHYIYLALDGMDEEIKKFIESTTTENPGETEEVPAPLVEGVTEPVE